MATPGLQPITPPARFRNLEVIAISFLLLVVPTIGSLYLSPTRGWLVTGVSMIVYLLFLGRWISGRPLGILINERNLMSLSRFQMVSWTILLLSAFFTVALKRVHVLSAVSSAQPLNIGMDWQLWAVMGISATSLVGTPLLLSTKTGQAADPKSVIKTANALGENPQEIQANSQGTLYSNPDVRDASPIDMFQGDEVGNTAYVDVSKVQMFYFTVIALIAYAYAVYAGLGNIYPQAKFSMPPVSDALVALLGISHAAYLTSKTTQHS